MRLEYEASDLKLIAKALQAISKETSYKGLAEALLGEALRYCRVTRGAVLLSEGGELLAKADARFPSEKARFFISQPSARELRMSADLGEKVLSRQQTALVETAGDGSALVDPLERSPRYITQLFLPLIHQEWTIGVLYLESGRDERVFTDRCAWVMSILASQAAASFESARLFEAFREANLWMVKGQEIGRMGSYRWNTRTLLSRASAECCRIFDIDPDINPVPFDAFRSRVHPDDLPGLERALTEAVRTRSPFNYEYRVVHRDGVTLDVVAVGQFDHGPSGDLELEGIITDVTEQKASERALADARNELARVSRLASVGELAGSIIHEINQPLTGIVMGAEACLEWMEQGPAKQDLARQSAIRVIEQAYRVSNVITGLKSLVRDAQLEFTDVDINEAIEEVLQLSKGELELSAVALHTDFHKSLANIKADRVQLQQVVLNLVRNAIEAMLDVEGRGRVLTVSSKAVGDHVVVRISDTGMGIAPSIRQRLFDALNTTKTGGLGLGLSICYKIVAAHAGRLWLQESTTLGTTFAFAVPLRSNNDTPDASAASRTERGGDQEGYGTPI
jgi:C4-dicarboxylate-specific signal transduction histidine kinase